MSMTTEAADANDAVLIDLSTTSLNDLLLDGDTPLDRAAQAAATSLTDEIYAAFGNVPVPR